jgi:diguanylate cyclase (GGDEF)-like protein/PAS domain S-box-containing protein
MHSASEKPPAPLELPAGLVIQTMMQMSEDTIYFKNLDSKFVLNSHAHAVQLGEPNSAAMVGKDDFCYFPEEFARAAYEAEQQIIATGKAVVGHVERWDHPDGTITWLLASKYPFYDAGGAVIGTWGTSKDITPLKSAEEQLKALNLQLQVANEQLEHLSIRDGLSGLFNHRHFHDSLQIAKAQESRQRESHDCAAFSLVLFDVDRFKQINDGHGHLVGDAVIRAIAEILVRTVRITDTCFRNGGDEFALILSGTDLEAGRGVAEKLRATIFSSPAVTEPAALHVTISVGVACSSEVDGVLELMRLADERMYRSKATGRNRVT